MDFKSLLEFERITTILKWAIMILITGFIAQFGKKFAEYLLGKAKKDKDNNPKKLKTESILKQELPLQKGPDSITPVYKNEKSKSELKALKKQEKASQKMLKKQNKL